MRGWWLLPALALGACGRSVPRVEHPRSVEGGILEQDSPGEAMRFHLQRRVPAGMAELPMDAYLRARLAAAKMARYSSRGGKFLAPGAKAESAPRWEALGPDNVTGRTRTLEFDPRNPDRMLAGGVSGGIWETTDAGASWHLLTDDASNINVGSLIIDPEEPEVIYAGTGELYRNNQRPYAAMWGQGILRSRDGGRSFETLAATLNDDFRYVADLAISPSDHRRLYAATNTGIWRSDDGGGTFNQVLRPADAGGNLRYEGCNDLLMRPDRGSDVLLASCSSRSIDDRYYLPNTVLPPACSGPCPATIYLNTDAAGAGAWQPVLSEAGMGRTTMDYARSNPQIVYAVSSSIVPGFDRTRDGRGDYDNGLHAIWRSSDGGRTWEARLRNSSSDALSTYLLSYADGFQAQECNFGPVSVYSAGWYNQAIAVNPRDPEILWVAGMEHYRSDDGGRSFGKASYWWHFPQSPYGAHADQHLLKFHPRYDGAGNRKLYSANDGGVAVTDNDSSATRRGSGAACAPRDGMVTWRSVSAGMGTVQFYTGAVTPDGQRYLGGAQDNGTLLRDAGSGAMGWRHIYGGDGASVAIDPRDRNLIYASAQDVSLGRSHDGGANFEDATQGLSDATIFIMPYLLDPNDPDRLYAGGTRLWRSDDQARNWRPVSGTFGTGFGARISAIAVSPVDENRVLIGNQRGIHRNLQATASTTTTVWPVALPREGWVSSLAFDPVDANVAYATYSTFGGAHVWRSDDAGASWRAIDGSGAGQLPDIPVHSLVVDPSQRSHLYIGTDLGVFVSLDGGAHWAVENTGFANVITETLALARGDATHPPQLFAFTYGRGAWRVPLADLETAAAYEIGDDISGSFYDPAQNGQGWVLEATQVGGQDAIAAAWYTYLGGEQRWLVGVGTPQGNEVRIALSIGRGGDFPPRFDPAAAVVEPWGEVVLRFDDADRGTARWTTGYAGFASGEMPLQRVSGIAAASAANALSSCHSGSWYDAQRPGHGLTAQVVGPPEAPQLAVVWYTYLEGRQRWLTGIGPIAGDHADLAMLTTRGADFPPRFDPAAVVREPWGTLRFTAVDANRARLEWNSTVAGFGSGSLPLTRLSALRGHACP